MKKTDKIVVIGGAGFIGSHLVEELSKKYNNVHVIDIKYNPNSYFVKSKLKKKATCKIVDIRNRSDIFHFIQKEQPNIVFHLAAEPIVTSAYDDPLDTFQTNVMGTAYILEACRNVRNFSGIIVASSDKAYGKLEKKKYIETDALKGNHPYEVSKSTADLISQTYYKTYGLPVIITRFGNVYGEGDINFSRIIPGIMKSIINNEVLEIRSNGKYVRDYLYVKDVVRGYMLLANKMKKCKGEAYNFGSEETLDVLGLVNLVSNKLKVKIKYKILNSAKNEIEYQHLNYEKITRLGWKPTETVERSCKKIFDWYKYNLQR